MKNLKIKMTIQQTQFIFAIIAKAELTTIDSLESLIKCIDIIQPVAKKYEEKANEAYNYIKQREVEIQTIQKMTEEKWTEEKKKSEIEKLEKEISDFDEKFGKYSSELHSFEIDHQTAVAMNAFLSSYVKEGTRFGGNEEMRKMLTVPALRIIHDTMAQLSPAVEKILEKRTISENK